MKNKKEDLVSILKYSKLCGVSFAAIIQRQKSGHLDFIEGKKLNIFGRPVKLIDVSKYPPKAAMKRGLKG